jgi:hypothetical protein
MTSLKIKLAMSAIAIAMLATPALAAGTTGTQQGPISHYPDGGAGRTGTAQSYQSGAMFN